MNAEYLSYSEYQAMGGTAEPMAFTALEHKARKRIDARTASRVAAMAAVPGAVKMLMLELIGLEESVGVTGATLEPGAVKSFQNDGYSVEYAEGVTMASAKTTAGALIENYLVGECDDEGAPLLYGGRSYV